MTMQSTVMAAHAVLDSRACQDLAVIAESLGLDENWRVLDDLHQTAHATAEAIEGRPTLPSSISNNTSTLINLCLNVH